MKRRTFIQGVAAFLAIPFIGFKTSSLAKVVPLVKYRNPEHVFTIDCGAGHKIVVKFFNDYIMRVYLDDVCMEDNMPTIDGNARIYRGGSDKWYCAIKCKRTAKDMLIVYWYSVSNSRKQIEKISQDAWDKERVHPEEISYPFMVLKTIDGV
ncbi:hypothetical protein M0R72_18175 [Candidatus Pacearchaeota archaeon]|nr:hypothetical protein [Candidatus Pacearchaeota archaeon]